MKTGLRPKRPSSLPVGKVAQATPTMTKAMGSVASFSVGANSVPMMPAISTIMEVPDIINAKAMVSRQTVLGMCRMIYRAIEQASAYQGLALSITIVQ